MSKGSLQEANPYRQFESYHHPDQKQGTVNTLEHLERTICKPEQLEKELHHLRTAVKGNK